MKFAPQVSTEPCVVCDGLVSPKTGVCGGCGHDNWSERITKTEPVSKRHRVTRGDFDASREQSEGHVAAAWLVALPGVAWMLYDIFTATSGITVSGLAWGTLAIAVVVCAAAWVGLEACEDDDAAWTFARVMAFGAAGALVLLGGVGLGFGVEWIAAKALAALSLVTLVLARRFALPAVFVSGLCGRMVWQAARRLF